MVPKEYEQVFGNTVKGKGCLGQGTAQCVDPRISKYEPEQTQEFAEGHTSSNKHGQHPSQEKGTDIRAIVDSFNNYTY